MSSVTLITILFSPPLSAHRPPPGIDEDDDDEDETPIGDPGDDDEDWDGDDDEDEEPLQVHSE